MSTIKDIFDIAQDGIKSANHINAIRKALKVELKLNNKCMSDIFKKVDINDNRRKVIIKNLEFEELKDAVKCDIPFQLICRKKVTRELAVEIKLNSAIDNTFEEMVEKLYLKIAYLKKDLDNNLIDLNLRLLNIYKFNTLLLKLLS